MKIARAEGFYAFRSLPKRFNNPGALRFVGQKEAFGRRGGFARFSTAEAGWFAVRRDIERKLARGLSIAQIAEKWAPKQNYLRRIK